MRTGMSFTQPALDNPFLQGTQEAFIKIILHLQYVS